MASMSFSTAEDVDVEVMGALVEIAVQDGGEVVHSLLYGVGPSASGWMVWVLEMPSRAHS